MNIGPIPTIGSTKESGLIDRQSEEFHLDRLAVAYAQFDAQMTAQLQELEFRFRDFWTPQAKKKEMLGRR